MPFTIDGEPNILAGFTCTPLVKFPVKNSKPGKKVRGTTVAELGNRNRPLDMIVYKKGGKDYLLMANSARGVMKVSTKNIERTDGITEPVTGGGIAGQTYDTIKELEGRRATRSPERRHGRHPGADRRRRVDLKTIALP